MDDLDRRKASIKSVLTCEICKKLCKNITIIEECCHRFCKKCITRQITKEKLNVCPECNLDLGVAPLKKIRPDHQVQGIMEILSNKRKECIARGLIKDKSKKGEPKKLAHDEADNSNSSNMLIDNPSVHPPPPAAAVATSSKRKKKSNSSLVESSTHVYTAESSKKNKSGKSLDGMNDLLEPLNKLVTKGGVTLDNSKSKEPIPKFTPVINFDGNDEDEDEDDDEEEEDEEHRVSKQNVVQKPNVVLAPAPSSNSNAKRKGKKERHGRKKKEKNNILPPPAAIGGGSNNNVAQLIGVTHHEATATSRATSSGTGVHPICFTLLACENQKCPSPLQQITPHYITIKDVNTPASYIKRYLVKKLSLQSEDEVEVRMLGMPIRPALPLQYLADQWLRVAPNNNTRKKVKVGNSTNDFVILLKYARSQKP